MLGQHSALFGKYRVQAGMAAIYISSRRSISRSDLRIDPSVQFPHRTRISNHMERNGVVRAGVEVRLRHGTPLLQAARAAQGSACRVRQHTHTRTRTRTRARTAVFGTYIQDTSRELVVRR